MTAPRASCPPEDDTGRDSPVLLIDDEISILRAMDRMLKKNGYSTLVAENAAEALSLFADHQIEAVISDIRMPGMSGIDLLREIRRVDLDIPVIFVTGAPSIESAVEAVKYGALQYLQKPFSEEELMEAVSKAVQMGRLARIRRRVLEERGLTAGIVSDLAGTQARFDNILKGIHMLYQPLYRSSDLSIFAFEALMRSDDQVLNKPGLVLSAAEQLDRIRDLGRVIRSQVAQTLRMNPGLRVFLNLHPEEIWDPRLLDREDPLSAKADRVILEITERRELPGSRDLSERIRDLKQLGYRLAVDDLGSGYSSLSSFLSIDPDFVKVDISLVRGAARDRNKQQLLQSVIELCRNMKIEVVAEGIETEEDRDYLISIGCDYLQGYLLARPGPLPSPETQF